MLLDVRTYRVKAGMMQAQFNLYQRYGKAPQIKYLGQPLAFMKTETGNPNEYLHIWVYEDAGDRERKRTALAADPDWQVYCQKSAELGVLEEQTNRLMTPVDFFGITR